MALVTVEEYRARQDEIRARIQEIDTEYTGQELPDEARSEWNDLNEEFDRNEGVIGELIARRERVQILSGEEGSRESGATFSTPRSGVARGNDIYDLATIRSTVSSPEEATREMRDRALRAVEDATFPHENADRERAQAHIERLLETCETSDGRLARHMLVTGSPIYKRAFGKFLSGGAPLLTAAENQALAQRALSLADANGGYAVPFTLDPTIIPTEDGAVNPYRAISDVRTIVTDEWKGVTSEGVTASRAAEAEEADDNSPTLAQPSVKPERVQAFVPFSIEIDQDWNGRQAEIAKMLQRAKDKEEAESFTTGDGVSPNAQGILTGATVTVEAAGTGSFASTDLDKAEEALPPAFRAGAVWLGNRAIYNKVRHFDTAGGADLWVRIGQGLEHGGNTRHELLGYSANESSFMPSVLTAGTKILVFGNFGEYFLIVDRIGMTIDLVPHLFGANRRPTGQRGVYAIWRNNSKVLSSKAFRVLVTGDGA